MVAADGRSGPVAKDLVDRDAWILAARVRSAALAGQRNAEGSGALLCVCKRGSDEGAGVSQVRQLLRFPARWDC